MADLPFEMFDADPSSFAENPLDTFRRHVWIAPFHEDDIALLRDLVGAENMIAGSDWPHAEGLAEPTDYVYDPKGLSAAEQKLGMRDNALALSQRRPV